jgi:hypothetical protein
VRTQSESLTWTEGDILAEICLHCKDRVEKETLYLMREADGKHIIMLFEKALRNEEVRQK